MKYMKIKAYNPHHGFSLIDSNIKLNKHCLINNVIKQTKDYISWEREHYEKSCEAFELMVYGRRLDV